MGSMGGIVRWSGSQHTMPRQPIPRPVPSEPSLHRLVHPCTRPEAPTAHASTEFPVARSSVPTSSLRHKFPTSPMHAPIPSSCSLGPFPITIGPSPLESPIALLDHEAKQTAALLLDGYDGTAFRIYPSSLHGQPDRATTHRGLLGLLVLGSRGRVVSRVGPILAEWQHAPHGQHSLPTLTHSHSARTNQRRREQPSHDADHRGFGAHPWTRWGC